MNKTRLNMPRKPTEEDLARKKDKEARREERRNTIAVNLVAGLNYRQMAEALGVSIGTISEDVKLILGRWQREQVTEIDKIKQLEIQRLDKAVNAIWDNVKKGKTHSILAMLRIMERRSKLLGLDKPMNQIHTVYDFSKATDEQLQRIRDGEHPEVVMGSKS